MARTSLAWVLLPLLACTNHQTPEAPERSEYVGKPNAPDMVFASPSGTSEAPKESRFFMSHVDLDVASQVLELLADPAPTAKIAARLRVQFDTRELSDETRQRFPKLSAADSGSAWIIPSFVEVRPRAHKPLPDAATFVLDYDEPSMVELFETVEVHERTPEGLELFVSQFIEDKTYARGFDIASRVAQLKAGDCTEHAVLLSALLRAAKIPARVVFGVVIALGPDRGFAAGHAWVEYADKGEWRRLDAALYGAAHPKGMPNAKNRVGIAELDERGDDAKAPLLWLYLTTDVLTEEGPAFSRFLGARALRGLVTHVNIGLNSP
jgi:Transglutaminase-like superfamily